MQNRKATGGTSSKGTPEKNGALLISHDFENMKSIELDEITALAYDIKTPDDYAGYLHYVLLKAQKMVSIVGGNLSEFVFTAHLNGCIMPFGEGGHSYCENFYSIADPSSIPPFPRDLYLAK